jgi:N-acetylglucosaminyl-diphospho-decaprenol L-rhamnosyltransferase
MTDVTIVIIAHDVRDEVLRAWASVDAGRDGLEVHGVLVDNGSSDGTADAVRREVPWVEVVELATNEGLPARNHGLRRARGRHVMFLDSDAALVPGSLSTLVRALDDDPSIGLVGPRLTNADGSLQLSTRRFPPLMLPFLRRGPLARRFEEGPTIRRHLMADDDHERRRDVEYVLGACMLFRRDVAESVGEIDGRIWFGHDDADWCFRIREAGWRIVYVPEATVVHDYRRTSASNPFSLFSLRFLLAHLHFQRKWWRRRRALMAQGREMDRRALAAPSPPPRP